VSSDNTPSPGIDTTVPHSARIWNYWLGGKDNFPVDREAGDAFAAVFPGIVEIARQDRQFLGRVVRFLAGEAGIRQFLDVGAGLPTVDNTHEVAQRVAPECRIVYVDHDPLVLSHGRALLTSSPEGAARYIDADLYDPDEIVRGAAETLDLSRPVALTLMGVLGHVGDYERALSIVRTLMDALVPGSYLAINDGTDTDDAANEAQRQYNESGALPYHMRSPEQIARFFDGLELVEPGFVPVPLWRPGARAIGKPPDLPQYGGVGRKT
jgi:O-methyltransferase involved in polyketide biosynthesis